MKINKVVSVTIQRQAQPPVMTLIKAFIPALVILLFLFCNKAFSATNPSWNDFITQLRTDALADGIKAEVFDEAFQNVHAPSQRVLHFDKTQPEKRLSFLDYRNSRVDRYRITLGRQEYRRNLEVLNDISRQFGVNACFIVSIWGLETSYGRYKGNFPVIQSLATLAYDPRRSSFFRNELRVALHMLNDGQVDLADFKGEWAGASGHCQFMPSTWFKYALDFDGTGRADIWNNTNDALASIANFLVKNGWHRNEPWAVQVALPDTFDSRLLTTKITKTVEEWSQLGIRPLSGDLPPKNLLASVINPDGGPAFMVFDNFKTLLKWNRSNYYVGALGYLAEEICQKPL